MTRSRWVEEEGGRGRVGLRVRFVDARGVAVANVSRAKASGVWEDWEKSMEENVIPPEETSGTPESVVFEALQVTAD